MYNRGMKLVFAQGNPGERYARTRHNVGFFVIDAFREARGGTPWKKASKANADVSEVSVDGEKVLLVKPLSYYNETGPVARALVDFYKLNPSHDVLVLHDELALPFGTVRVREKGSDAGNNGIRSLNSHLGSDYARIRVGIWNELRDAIDDADFVLSAFTKKEAETLQQLTQQTILPLITAFINDSLEVTSHTHA